MDIDFNDSLGMTSLEFNNREIVLFALLCERLISEEKIWDILPTYCDEEVINDIIALGTEVSTRIPAHSRKHIFCAPPGDWSGSSNKTLNLLSWTYYENQLYGWLRKLVHDDQPSSGTISFGLSELYSHGRSHVWCNERSRLRPWIFWTSLSVLLQFEEIPSGLHGWTTPTAPDGGGVALT